MNLRHAGSAMLAAAWLAGCSPTPSAGPATPAIMAPPEASATAAAGGDYQAELARWRAERLAQLRAPDGWLSFSGSGRLRRPGQYRLGAAGDNDVVLPGGPPYLGVLTLAADGSARLRPDPAAWVRLKGQRLQAETPLRAETPGQPGDHLQLGSAYFYLVRTGPVTGWRFRDPEAPGLLHFAGVEHFPDDPDWRIVAEWHPYPSPRPITLLTSIGTPLQASMPGEAVFERDGRRYRLAPISSDDDGQLFFLFADRTSGKETYGGARYLFVDKSRDGQVVLDFNRAENPPCAFTAHVVCPIAPPQNRLDLSVDAGEKVYLAPH